MDIFIIITVLITVLLICALVFIICYNSINETNSRINKAQEKIDDLLKKKYLLMQNCYKLIKKSVKKKDYLKEFNDLKIDKFTSYELDNELNTHFETMKMIKDSYKSLNTKEYNNLINSIDEANEDIIASKKFFNKYNNILIKKLTGINKIVAKLTNVKVRTSYEVKEPIEG